MKKLGAKGVRIFGILVFCTFLGRPYKVANNLTVEGRETGRKETENEYMYETPSCEKHKKKRLQWVAMLDANVRYYLLSFFVVTKYYYSTAVQYSWED